LIVHKHHFDPILHDQLLPKKAGLPGHTMIPSKPADYTDPFKTVATCQP
jgi:hypothetical protein